MMEIGAEIRWLSIQAQSALGEAEGATGGRGGEGLIALDFVWVSLFVGVVMVVALAYLLKRTGI